jgi:uncharacterized protein YndB with AHSA1/START domain
LSVLRIERAFPAEPEKVFAFVTQKDNLLKWWGPEGTSIAEHNLDLSRLGPWWFVLVDPQGGRHKVTGHVLAIDPPNSVEFTLVVPSENGVRGIDSVVRFEIAPDGAGGSHFLLIQSGLTDDELAAGSSQGWVSTLRRLAALLNGN